MIRVLLSLCLLTLLLSGIAHSLETDREQKVFITADSGVYNFKSGVDVYKGHVKVDQGTSHIRADKLITKRNKQRQIEEVLAYGFAQPAHYWTLTTTHEPPVHAHARFIHFFPLQQRVTLKKAVWIQQGQNSFRGQLIRYNQAKQVITVPPSHDARAVIVYQPESR